MPRQGKRAGREAESGDTQQVTLREFLTDPIAGPTYAAGVVLGVVGLVVAFAVKGHLGLGLVLIVVGALLPLAGVLSLKVRGGPHSRRDRNRP